MSDLCVFIVCLFCYCTVLKKLLGLSSTRMIYKVGNDESIRIWKEVVADHFNVLV